MNQSKLSQKMKNSVTEKNNNHADDLCCVCYREVQIYSIGECNHPVCYECCTRMRILCSTTECAICRKDMAAVKFTATSQPYASMNHKHMTLDRKFSIYFEDDKIMSSYDKLLEHVCKECNKIFDKFCYLEKHMIDDHKQFFCHLCVSNLKSFTHERKYYPMNLLKIHRSDGDADDKSHRGHPLCEYCSERYMDKDALFLHLRTIHYHCHFCDADGIQKFYNDYSHLRKHFKEGHFLCEEGDCCHERFTSVFRTNLDLKVHWTQTHSHTVSKQEARQARTLETEFHVFWRPNSDRNRGGRSNENNRMGHGIRTVEDLEDQATAAAALPPSVSVQKPVNIKSSQDFPSLDGAPSLAAAERKNNNHSKSMSQRFAEQNKFSVRSGNRNLTQEDFPLLSSVVSVNNSLPAASVQVSVNRKNSVPISTPSNVSIQYKQRGQNNDNKKPRISSISHSNNITLASSGARPKISSEEYPALSTSNQYEKPTWVKPPPKNVANGNLLKKENKPAKVKPTKPDFGAIKEFPSLGGSSGNLQQVLSYTGKSSVTVPMKKAVPISQLAQSAASDLKNIKKQPPTTKANDSKKKKKINLSNILSDPDEPEVDLSMTRLGDYQSMAAKRAPNVSLVRQEDLVKSELKIGELAPPKFKKCDFPSLGGGTDVHEDVNSNWRKAPTEKSVKNNKKPTNISLEMPFSINSSELSSPTYEFLLPPNFDDRNRCLISTISTLCEKDPAKFNRFKNVASQLRNDQLDYNAYYNQCKAIMGKANFLTVLPELLALLPDIKMQQGILDVFRKTDGNKGYRVQFAICSTCQQVLLPEDFSAHVQTHEFIPVKKPKSGKK